MFTSSRGAGTDYSCIVVSETQQEGHPLKVMNLDRLIHSVSKVEDPALLYCSRWNVQE